jgi:hypothetical protein
VERAEVRVVVGEEVQAVDRAQTTDVLATRRGRLISG